jgi:hypothetical protein
VEFFEKCYTVFERSRPHTESHFQIARLISDIGSLYGVSLSNSVIDYQIQSFCGLNRTSCWSRYNFCEYEHHKEGS